MIDIINAFSDKQYEKALAAGFLNPRNNPLGKQVKFHKIIAYQRTSSLKRIMTWGIAFLQILWLAKTKYKKAHLFIVSNPPFATLLPLLCRNPYSLLIYDIYPQALVEYKVLSKTSSIVKWWHRANEKIYKNASQIFTLSEGMKDNLTKYVETEKIKVVPVWTDNDFFVPISKENNPFIKEHKLEDRFVILYAGNLGKTHEIEKLVDLAAELKSHQKIYFLIIGSGEKFELINNKIAEFNLSNIKLLPWQPTNLLPAILSAADVGVVSLGKEASSLSVPSKAFNLMSNGLPILSIGSNNSELAKLVARYQLGGNFEIDEFEAIKEFIIKVYQDLGYFQTLKQSSKKASSNFTPANAKCFSAAFVHFSKN